MSFSISRNEPYNLQDDLDKIAKKIHAKHSAVVELSYSIDRLKSQFDKKVKEMQKADLAKSLDRKKTEGLNKILRAISRSEEHTSEL